MSDISTHVLDVSRGRPASGLDVTLEIRTAASWEVQGRATTGDDGRIASLFFGPGELVKGTYRLTFDTGCYFRRHGRVSFYPQVVVIFEAADAGEHYHIPLLLNDFGYTTYRGG